MFPTLAARYGVPLVPFLLAGVALNPEMNGSDGIHPNAAGAQRVAETVWPHPNGCCRRPEQSREASNNSHRQPVQEIHGIRTEEVENRPAQPSSTCTSLARMCVLSCSKPFEPLSTCAETPFDATLDGRFPIVMPTLTRSLVCLGFVSAARDVQALASGMLRAAAARMPPLHALLVSRHGEPVLVSYAKGQRPLRLTNVTSISKSIISALVVAAASLSVVSPPTAMKAAQSAVSGNAAASEAIPYFVADGAGRTGYRAGDRQLAAWALAAWQRSAGPALRFEPAPEKQALLRIYWADAAEGQYGQMQPFMLGGQRGAALHIRPDTAALGPDIARQTRADPLLRDTIVYLTCLHELGHALGLRHTDAFDEIMYSFQYGGDLIEYFSRYRRQLKSRADIAAVSGLAAADIEHLRALYPATR